MFSGEGTRTPIAISVLVRDPSSSKRGEIFFNDIGDYLDQKEKLAKIKSLKSIGGIQDVEGWKRLIPDRRV